MPILKNNKHELFAHPDYNCARWRHRHGKPARLGFDRSFTSGHWPSVVHDKFYANLTAKMDEGELNTIASELLEGIRRDDESRREHLEMLSEGFKLLGLVIETATTTSVSSSAPLEGMSTVRHPLLLEACSLLFQANAMGEMLPAAGPVKVRDDRPQKPSGADMMGHNDGPALDGTNPFSTPPAPQAPAQATPGIPPPGVGAPGGSPPRPPAAAGMGPLRPPIAGPTPAMGAPAAPGPMPGAGPGASWRRPCRQRPSFRKSKSATRSRIALERDMNHYLIFLANAPNLRGRCDDHLPLAVRVEECRTLGRRLRTLGQCVRHKVKLGAGGNRPAYQALKSLATRRHRSSTAAAGSRSE